MPSLLFPPRLARRWRGPVAWMCVLLLCNLPCAGGESPIEHHLTSRPSHRGHWLERVLEALESATGFFEKNYDRIILDGIFGLRIAEGTALFCLVLILGVV